MPRIEGLQQNTPEWLVHRIGMFTASHADVTVKGPKSGKYPAGRAKYMLELARERLTGRAANRYCTPAMEHGIETEPRARAAYEMARDIEVEDGGFWVHDILPFFGASPDGLVGTDGLIEIKCPTETQHMEYYDQGIVPDDYKPQMLAQLACTRRKWCDFISFDDRDNLPTPVQLFVVRFEPKPEEIADLEAEVRKFYEDMVLKMGAWAERCQEMALAE